MTWNGEKKNAKASNNTHQILYRKDNNQILLKIETKKQLLISFQLNSSSNQKILIKSMTSVHNFKTLTLFDNYS